jgi:hypothetical protein
MAVEPVRYRQMPMPPALGTRKVYFFSFPVTLKILLEYGQAVICSYTNQYKWTKKLTDGSELETDEAGIGLSELRTHFSPVVGKYGKNFF